MAHYSADDSTLQHTTSPSGPSVQNLESLINQDTDGDDFGEQEQGVNETSTPQPQRRSTRQRRGGNDDLAAEEPNDYLSVGARVKVFIAATSSTPAFWQPIDAEKARAQSSVAASPLSDTLPFVSPGTPYVFTSE